MNNEIIKAILELIAQGMDAKEAINKVCGAGAFEKLAGEE